MKTRFFRLVILVLVLGMFVLPALADSIAQGPYLQNATQNGITVCWVSDTETEGSVACVPEKTKDAKPSVTKETAKTRYHRVKLTGLKPYTRYTYTVSCEGAEKKGSFITAAGPKQPFHFAAYGDNRTQPARHAEVLVQMLKSHPDFVLQTGDQVANGANESQWKEFFTIAEPMLRQTTYYPSLGNHEAHGAPYFRYFAVPNQYSFDYGNAHFVALDSDAPDSEWKTQEEFLRKDLAAHRSATWRVVYFHHTVHTCVSIGGRRERSVGLRQKLEPIFKQYDVQLVVNGHDHNYQHHFAEGIHYLVTGGGGAPLYDLKTDTPFVKTAKKVHHHCEFTVDGANMTVKAVESNGEVIETFQIHASPTTAALPSHRASAAKH